MRDFSFIFVTIIFALIESTVSQKPYSYALGRNIPQQSSRRGFNSSLPHPCEKKSCYPATGNLLIGREARLSATSTCGLNKREKFCIVSHLKDSKKCFPCESNQRTQKDPRLNHEVRNIIYKFFPGTRQESWWQSENGKENVSITLDLEAEFHFTHLIIVFKTFRPAAMSIERSYDFGKTWQVYSYFASDCNESFPNIPASGTAGKKITDVTCESRYSKVSPSTNGEVIFRVLPPQMWVDDPYAPDVQDLLRMTNLRINFKKLHTLGDDLLDNRAEIQEKYYYAITSMVVRGSCSCYGHASQCLPLDPSVRNVPNMVHGRCDCVHNTRGANCEECEHFYNDLPWQPAGKQTNACKRCNCNNHADSCHFDWAVYINSGNISGGVCDVCQHNTMGSHCEMCKPYYYLDQNKDIQDPEACVLCDCDPIGSTDSGVCDSITDELTDRVAGSCHCKTNVEGRRCDACKNGFWNFTAENPDGCQTCTCNTLGTVDNQGCDTYTGECTCKRFVTGRDCNQCLTEYWGLSERRDGCQPCDCDPGGAFDNHCDVITGQCPCRENIQGRRCDQPKQYYFAPSLEYLVFEAEAASTPENSQIIIREPYRNGQETTWTGQGFVDLLEASRLKFDVKDLPRTTTYDIAIRYEPKMQGVWENALVHIVRPEPIDPNGPCFNTKPSDDNAPVTFHPSSRSVTVVPPACLEVNKTYEIIIDLRRYQTVNESPAASILIDSIILIPRVDRLPIFSDPHITENRLDEYYRNCKYVDRGEVIKTQIPNICKKHHMSISFQFFNKAYPCNCNETGSTSKLCVDYGGICQCKPRVVGRQCDECASGTYGFGPEGCKPCDCSGLGSRDNYCDPITGQCKCKNTNTYGRQCDQCRPGFWAFPNCQRCECNGHADTCDLRTGACIDCRDSTVGHNCKQCINGYYGDPRIAYDIPCRPCPCPGPIGSNHSHADTCSLDTNTKDVVCECHNGYSGLRCDVCDDNFYGHPELPGGQCEECNCNNNVDITRPGNCNPHTGQCIQCLFNTEGDECEMCKAGYYGDATMQTCRECVCDVLGTDHTAGPCDRMTGQCPCKENVTELDCGKCKEDHWRIALGNGCEPCSCDPVGSVSTQCNTFDGQCSCKPGFGGRQCDQCTANHWGNPTIECFPCDCDPHGSLTLQCDQNNGSCICQTGISGDKCNKCARGFLGQSPYCSPCGECFTNWDRILDENKEKTKDLIKEVNNTIQIGTTGAYTEQFESMENSLSEIQALLNETSASIQEATELQNTIETKKDLIRETEELVNAKTKAVGDITKNITVGMISLQILEKQTAELKEDSDQLRNNATKLQEGNVELALTLTEDAKRKVDQLIVDVNESNKVVDITKQNCKAAEALVNRTKTDKFDGNKNNLDDLNKELNQTLHNITLLNEDICDRKDDENSGICDSICGGANCGTCGGVSSCDEGAVVKVQNAELLAKEASQLIRNHELKAQELLRNLYQINLNTTKAHENVEKAYVRASETNKRANYHLDNINEKINQIKNLNISNKDSPKELQALVQKILTLKITSKPEDIQDLSDKISKAVTTLTDIDAILRETDPDKNRVKELQALADDAKNKAEQVLQKSNDITKALDEADLMKKDVDEMLSDNTNEIQNFEDNLAGLSKESDVAQEKAKESVSQVESLQQRLGSLKVHFLKNGRDGLTVENEAKSIVKESEKAHTEAEELQKKYLEANKSLAKEMQQSQNIKDRAKNLYQKAAELGVNIDSKIRYLNELSQESSVKEQKLKSLSDTIDRLNSEMNDYLAVIRRQSSYYRRCMT